MQVQNRINNPFAQRNHAVSSRNSLQDSQTFALNLAISETFISKNTSQPSEPISQKEIAPFDLYRQMTGRSEEVRSSKVVAGVTWTDETLAVFARKGNAEVNTSRAINWNATGSHVLTDEELKGLREKYDLENLSGQDFYDLMADLTELDAISAEDIHGMFLKKASPSGLYPQSSAFSDASFVSGNIFKTLESELESISSMKGFMLSDEFWLVNPSTSRNKHNDYIAYLDSRAGSMNKLYNVFSSIRG